MPLITTKEMLLKAQRQHYAVAAFNVENMEMVQAVIAAAKELNAPVILQTTPSTVKYASPKMFYANVQAAVQESGVCASLHLDHGSDYELAVLASHAGYTSIMIDGSHKPFEENIEVTKKVVEMCSIAGIPVEAELGKVGGKEDDLDGGSGNAYTDPGQAKEYAERTQISSLAIAIGTAHGFYKGEPKLDLDRLTEIRNVVDIPLVLHGASGVPDEAVRESIKRGICKVNFATELRVAFTDGIKEVLRKNADTIDPKKLGEPGRQNVKSLVMEKMKVCGCAGRQD